MSRMPKILSRREFFRTAAQIGISGATLAGLLQIVGGLARAKARERDEGEAGHDWAMVIDLNACIGCNYCTYACKAVNDTAPDIMWNIVLADDTTFSRPVFLPRPCTQCEDAPCVEVCPVGATYHRTDGLVAMDYDRCIGCRYCQVACPWGAVFQLGRECLPQLDGSRMGFAGSRAATARRGGEMHVLRPAH
jgi:Fe-S-cluster-containing hydrogenase component 2